ncbi:MAG: type III pantothenate kinase [Sphingobacteriia bacterium]|nr:type III pantothenate kinase [Sphingobacteriia bacterium]
MLLCLDIGNSQIYGGFYDDTKFIHEFRLNSKMGWSEDHLGTLITAICKDQKIDPSQIQAFLLCSVVPSLDVVIRRLAKKYFNLEPFEIKPHIKTGLVLDKFRNPNEIGADLIAGAIGAVNMYPNTNLLIIDMGTATTLVAINKAHEFIGGVIIPGLQTQLNALIQGAEKLSSVELTKPTNFIGHTTTAAIQSGILNCHYGGIKYLVENSAKEVFGNETYKVIGTGGLVKLIADDNLFNNVASDLLLKGLIIAYQMNGN